MGRTLLMLTLLVASLTACMSVPPTALVAETPQPTLPATVAGVTVAPPTTTPPPTSAPLPTAAPTATPSPTTATTASAFPTGTFTNTPGWTLEFTADGRQLRHWSADEEGVVFNASGTYTVTGNQVVFKDSASDCALDPKLREGTYTWAYDGKVLSFKVLDDRCGDREGTATSTTWLKKP